MNVIIYTQILNNEKLYNKIPKNENIYYNQINHLVNTYEYTSKNNLLGFKLCNR